MTPNKIYINVHPLGVDYSIVPIPNFGGVEYIRKDALLKWAKKKYNEYKQIDEDFQGDVFIGNRHAFAEVIAKIESL